MKKRIDIHGTLEFPLAIGCAAFIRQTVGGLIRTSPVKHFITLPSPDALFIIGKFPTAPELPDVNQNLIHIDSTTIDSNTLMPKDEFIEKLFDEGGTFTDLASLCEANETAYGTPLYWMHPFTDGEYNGCYFVLVREGVLVLSYDEISTCDHEMFTRDSAHLCNAEEMRCFLTEWNIRSTALIETITTLLSFLERKERLCCER